MNTFVVFVAVAAALAVAASASPVILTGQFKERRPEWAMAFLKGQFYYLYDASDPKNCRLRLNYVLDSTDGIVANLYHYEDGAMYSISGTNCTGLLTSELPDPWWVDNGLYEKTDKVENGMVWYVRRAARTNASAQVMRILMKEGSQNPNTANYLGAIEFYRGHNITFQSVTIDTQHGVDDPMFAPITSCPKPTCPIYADIVFVLDSSGSVRPEEWRETVYFVNAVMNSFTFGKNAVEAAVVQFCGQDAGINASNKVTIKEPNNPKCKSKTRFSGDYNYPKAKSYKPTLTFPDDRMADILAGADYDGSGQTVSPNRDELMRLLNRTLRDECAYPPGWETQTDKWKEEKCENFPGWRGTCQALGLKLAMQVLDRSPRKDLNTKPHNIVIVVTDGEDKFPNMTQENATLIKLAPYDALLIEVGVGLECEYDKNYLRSISSRLGSGTSYAYFDASDYGEIKKVVDELFKPLCDSNFSTACGPECKGFCAAGQCLCPDCDMSPDVCHFVKCNVSGGFSNGCVMYDKPYEIVDDACTTWQCDEDFVNASAEQNGKWEAILNQCEEMNQQYPGECRHVECDPVYGGCRVTINETVCQLLAENACQQYECTPLNLTPVDLVTGCRLKTNFTQNCLNNLGARSACMDIVCDGSSLKCEDMEVDTCKSRDTACETYKCQEVAGGKYECVGTPTPHPEDTSCVTWKCNDTEGWYVDINRDEAYCKEKYSGDTTCKTFYCDTSITQGDIEGGCTFKERDGCSGECTEGNETYCKAIGIAESNVSYCVLDYCIVERNPDDPDSANVLCASDRSKAMIENCLDKSNSAYKMAKELNEANPANCYTPACENTKCTYVKVELPDEMKVNNFCMEPRCMQNDDGSWGWVMKPTKLNETCHSDACYIRECVPESGCVVQDNCSIYSDECYSYSCQVGEDHAAVCSKKDLTVEFQHLECMNEICKDGKKTPVYSECHTDDKCMIASCVKGGCVYTPISPPGDDLCMTYTCDPTTGNWTTTPNCDDGLYCTIDECWNYGTFYQCRHDPVECSDYLSMKGYDCFRPFCKENETNFRCVRKLLPNAYIDICGNCIQEKPEQQYSVSSDAADNTEESVDPNLIQCTGAPAKPMMVETLAAATIGLIIIAAIVAGAATTTSAIIGTKTLIARVKEANNMAAQCNPLFEGIETELTNPTYAG